MLMRFFSNLIRHCRQRNNATEERTVPLAVSTTRVALRIKWDEVLSDGTDGLSSSPLNEHDRLDDPGVTQFVGVWMLWVVDGIETDTPSLQAKAIRCSLDVDEHLGEWREKNTHHIAHVYVFGILREV